MIRNISEHVYVIENEIASNSTLVIGKSGCILIDTTLFPEKAKKIKDFAKEISGKRIELVINTHYHPDHTFGNHVFECPIVAHKLTKEAMEKMDDSYLENIGMKNFEVKFPDVVFEEDWTYEDGIKIYIYHGPGHTPDSSYVFIPSENVVVAGDTIVSGIHAEIVFDSNIDLWLKTLEKIPKAKYIVPGHGLIAKDDEVIKMKEYILKLRQLIRGELLPSSLENDQNFSMRTHPELLEWGLENFF
ncbi:MBL fold metallo-hydrolase [Thermosipho ferrireducens]|uniref:MBL fold metallo-hydrolase n=1 Tax=Thermosipho ferrireducens TaxID=2571116 RepID=A0ABX7SA19_9BACT|nr:MBL fold metallo-hydrolase [Thermosipho ferrireducens]QTA38750.1 MBL fold metallo-hydrolase [Thermosipho ferrireducens]